MAIGQHWYREWLRVEHNELSSYFGMLFRYSSINLVTESKYSLPISEVYFTKINYSPLRCNGILVCCNSVSKFPITARFCTCHYITSVMSCTKSLYQNWDEGKRKIAMNYDIKSFVKWTPGPAFHLCSRAFYGMAWPLKEDVTVMDVTSSLIGLDLDVRHRQMWTQRPSQYKDAILSVYAQCKGKIGCSGNPKT